VVVAIVAVGAGAAEAGLKNPPNLRVFDRRDWGQWLKISISL